MYTILLIFLISSCLKTISSLDKSKEKKLTLKKENEKRILIPDFIEKFEVKENFITSIKSGSLRSIYSQQYPLHLSIYSYIYDKSDENFQGIKKSLVGLKDLEDLLPEEDFQNYINGYDTRGLTPLHAAILSKDYRVIELIFSEKYGFRFDVNIATAYEKVTPLSLAISLRMDIRDSYENMDKIINELFSLNSKIEVLDNDNISECGYAALSGNIKVVKKIVEELKYNFSEKEVSPLALAVANNNYEILDYLSDKENYQDWSNLKKLEFVSYIFKNSNLEELRISLKEKPILAIIEKYIEEYKNIKDVEGKTPLIYSIEFNNQKNINKNNSQENLNYDPKLIFNMCTSDNNYELVQNLLNQKIDFDLRDSKNNTPLHISLKKDATKIAKILIDEIGTKGINKANYKGQIPLHIAVMNNHFSLVEELLEREADVNGKDKNGNTPLHYAVSNENTKMISLLLSKGAEPNIKNQDGYVPKDLTDDSKIISMFEIKDNPLDEMREQIKNLSTLINEIKNLPLATQIRKDDAQNLLDTLKMITNNLETKGPKELNDIKNILDKQIKMGIKSKKDYQKDASLAIEKVNEYIDLIKDADIGDLEASGIKDPSSSIQTLTEINNIINQIIVE